MLPDHGDHGWDTASLDRAPDLAPNLTNLDAWARAWHDGTAVDLLADAVAARELTPSNTSGAWWSTPIGPWHGDDPTHPGRAPLTTPPLREWHDVGSAELAWVEDHGGWEEALVVPVAPVRTPRVYEVTGPQDWADLVRRFPACVTGGRFDDWFRHTGRAGRWAVPDWLAVREEYDAVHITIAGYLTTAGLAVPVRDGANDDGDVATVLAGWSPDVTAWLTDVLQPVGSPDRVERWRLDRDLAREHDHGWRRVVR